MKRISIDNGSTWISAEEALNQMPLDTMAVYMDDDTREAIHAELAPCDDLEFLQAYLGLAKDDLIIG